MHSASRITLTGVASLLLAGTAWAGNVDVIDDITMSTVWTADNVYNLTEQIYIMPGATLTIEAGTVVASTPTENGSGSLAVTRGAQIFVEGTADNPVIMTSTADMDTWTDGDPKTGTWREAANEWGNLTIMGNGLISASMSDGAPVVINGVANSATPTGLNQQQMEGLQGDLGGGMVAILAAICIVAQLKKTM